MCQTRVPSGQSCQQCPAASAPARTTRSTPTRCPTWPPGGAPASRSRVDDADRSPDGAPPRAPRGRCRQASPGQAQSACRRRRLPASSPARPSCRRRTTVRLARRDPERRTDQQRRQPPAASGSGVSTSPTPSPRIVPPHAKNATSAPSGRMTSASARGVERPPAAAATSRAAAAASALPPPSPASAGTCFSSAQCPAVERHAEVRRHRRRALPGEVARIGRHARRVAGERERPGAGPQRQRVGQARPTAAPS